MLLLMGEAISDPYGPEVNHAGSDWARFLAQFTPRQFLGIDAGGGGHYRMVPVMRRGVKGRMAGPPSIEKDFECEREVPGPLSWQAYFESLGPVLPGELGIAAQQRDTRNLTFGKTRTIRVE